MEAMSGPAPRDQESAHARLHEELARLADRPHAAGGGLGASAAHAVAAWTLAHAFEYEAAELAWARVVELEPRSLEAVYQRGMCLLELGRYADAERCFRAALALDAALRSDPDAELLDWIEDDPALRLGNCRHALGDLDGAIEAYELSARRNTVAPDALREIARCRLARGDGAGALAALTRMQQRATRPAQRAEIEALRAEALRVGPAGGGS